MTHSDTAGGIKTRTRDRVRLKEPKLFQVFLLNDDYTTMDFVVSVLETIFHKSPSEAVRIMLQVHNNGQGGCGAYTKEVAEMKVAQVHSRAKQEGHPLRCDIQEI
jgi:ATP-dependent Clp protease adaptor protein ClpS